MRTVDDWKRLLRTAIRTAMREKDPAAVAVARETLAAVENGEAADLDHAPLAGSEVIAGAVDGLGAGDVARRQLTADDVATIVDHELRERRAAATSYAAIGRPDEAATMTRQADILEAWLRPDDGPAPATA